MAEPITKAQYLAKSKKRPTQLFAHNTQQKLSQNLDATTSSRSDGVLGRMVDSLRGDGTRCGMYSIAGSTTVLEPQTTSTYDILTRNGVTQLSLRQRSLLPDIINMSNQISQSVFAETWSSQLVSALYRTTSLGAALNDVTLNTSFPSCSGGNRFACDLRQVAKIMHANRDLLNNERDVFFVQMGGFDVHSDAVEKLASTLLSVDGAISDFESEMKSLGLWDAVTIVQASDFARTLTSNGDGTDHAWGGNSFVLGGAVRGGQIVGQYPNDLTNDGPQSIGRGRLVPSTAWETIWNGVGEWFGVPARDMDTVLPRRQFFPTLFAAADIFDP
jgi:cullin-associated NEDD8-dissociated protein 1